MEVLEEKFVALEAKGIDFALKVNDAKTELIIIFPSNRSREQNVTTFKVVDKVVYPESELNIKLVRRASKCSL